MTDLNSLSHNWQALQGMAPDLLLPITDDQSLKRVTAAVRQLSKEIQAMTDGPHTLDSLVELVLQRIAAYEAEHDPIPDVPGEEVLGFMMKQHHLTQEQLADATGIKQETISALLNGKRKITADHARKFAAHFKLGISAFL